MDVTNTPIIPIKDSFILNLVVIIIYKTLFILIIALTFCITGCFHTSIKPLPEPIYIQTYIAIPAWITEPQHIGLWLKTEGAQYSSDEFLTGYRNYYFTPAEMVMAEIPDVNHPGNIIEKQPFHGDCDDFAIFTAYLLDYLGYESYYVAISNGLTAHAIAYAEKKNSVVVFDLWYSKEGYINLEDYIAKKYPSYTIRKKTPINEFLEQLFTEGHIKYAY